MPTRFMVTVDICYVYGIGKAILKVVISSSKNRTVQRYIGQFTLTRPRAAFKA